MPNSLAVTFHGGVAGFLESLSWRLFMFGLLVPVSDVTWQVSTHPCPHQSQLTGIIHKPVARDFAHLPTMLLFHSHLRINNGLQVLRSS